MTKTLGETLKLARESLGKSISEAAFQTKIREHYLIAMEKDDYSSLPSLVQGKGFLRIYASYLELAEKPLISAWQHPDHLVIMSDFEEKIDDGSNTNVEIIESISEVPDHEIPPQTIVIHQFEEDNLDNIPDHNLNSDSELSPSQKIFKELGSKIQKQREMLNLSLEDIEKFTNIRTKYLQAIETGDLVELPSLVQGRGMLNNYSKFLNMDSDELLLMFAEGLQTKRNEQYAPQKLEPSNNSVDFHANIKPPGWRRFITADLLIVSTIIISLFVFVLWGAANLTSNNNGVQTDVPPSISSVLLEEATQTIAITTTPTLELVVSNGENFANTENNTDENTTLEIPSDGNIPLQIYIIAKQRAFLKVTSDSKIVFNGRIVPGNAYEFSGNEVIEILTGNAAALDIYFNQNQLGSIGETGEVKTYLFTLTDGIVTPTLQFTSTFTVTPIPSNTPSPTITASQEIGTATSTVTPFIP